MVLRIESLSTRTSLNGIFRDFSDSKSELFYAGGICDLLRRWEKVTDNF